MIHQKLEEQSYWQKWAESRDSESGDFLVKKYMPLVHYHVQRVSVHLPKNVSRDDVRSFGMIGLFDALEKFDTKRDLKFDTYASFRIRGAILDGLRKEDWLPRNTREKIKKIEAAIRRLEQRLMRNATIQEISEELHMSEEDVQSAMNQDFFANILSINEKLNDEDDKEEHELSIKDDNADLPEDHLVKNELIRELSKTIVQLNKNEQLVLSLFYKEELTLTEIGQVMNLSTSRISQIHSKAISKLRQGLGKIS
jgi:RNA polymerase sigma factor FliA